MSWGQAAEGASAASESAGAAGNMVESASASSPDASGFAIEPASTGTEAGNVPTDGTSASLTPNQAADSAQYGTSNPTFMDKSVNSLERFQKGGNQNLADTYKNFGNNAETYGAAYGLVNKMAGSGKPAGAAPITTNINTQQPVNPYLQKRGRY